MSVKRWRQRGKEKAELEEQEQEIRQEFKMNKVKKVFGQISGEELFKPITQRLDKVAKEPEPVEDPAGPDYEMDEFDRLNPFDDEFRPDDETPPPSPTPPLAEEESDDEFRPDAETPQSPPPAYEEVHGKTKRKAWETPVKPEPKMHESNLLRTIRSLITKNKHNPDYWVKSKDSILYGYSFNDLVKMEKEISDRIGEPSKSSPNPLDDTSWEMEGSGLGAQDAADKLIHQLYVSLGSIKAGNTSKKLRKQVVDLLQLLTNHGVINEFQRKKIFRDYISP